jgi:hypothetical protein
MFKCLSIFILIILLKFGLNHSQKQHEDFIDKGKSVRREISNLTCNLTHLHGTTRKLKEIFLGRCHYYINYHPKVTKSCDFDRSKYNCDKLWQEFYNITSRHTTNVMDYDELLKLTDMSVPDNQSLFWSGTKKYVLDCK